MKLSFCKLFLLSVFIFALLHQPAHAVKRSYVVYLGGHSHGIDVLEIDLTRVTETHYDLLSSHLGSSERARDAIFYSYTKHINGFAAMLEEEEAESLSRDPKVVSVFLNKGRELHTTRTWDFLRVEKNGRIPAHSIWRKAKFGKDIIIGNLDTGVWPESQSFHDEGMGPIPSKWRGGCQNNTNTGVPCNRKLIGARYYNEGYKAYAREHNITLNSTINSARDEDGHGSHTLSTAGGRFVPRASIFGFGKGEAKGGSPEARVAAYKVCWKSINSGRCFSADILAAFDDAIHDGVDVLSLSIGGDPSDYFQDSIPIGAFHAVQKGIAVVCSAGNSGPAEGSVSNLAPWILTVGASTMDRDFPSSVFLGNNKSFQGQSLSARSLPANKYFPLISAADAQATNTTNKALLCLPNSLDPNKVKGKILVCLRGTTARWNKGVEADRAGAAGMILANDLASGDALSPDTHVLPATHITYTDGQAVFEYIKSTKSSVAYLTPARTQLHTKPAPFMASFSSQGPNSITPEILKPDLTAPGVNVLAAYTQALSPTGLDEDKRRVLFNFESGTSMSCPHVTGIVGLLKTLHPDWSPSAIKSAIMTSASLVDNVKEPILNGSFKKATPFNYGAGHVCPNCAADPGLVYDLTIDNYLNFLCGLGYNETQLAVFSAQSYVCPKSYSILDLNYPSITVPNLSDSVTITRTVKNVGVPSTYHATVHDPNGISVTVVPKMLQFKEIGEEKSFQVTLKAKNQHAAKEYVFGKLAWFNGINYVRSPIVVKQKLAII